MAQENTSGVALVAGGSGIAGHAVAKELKRQAWTVWDNGNSISSRNRIPRQCTTFGSFDTTRSTAAVLTRSGVLQIRVRSSRDSWHGNGAHKHLRLVPITGSRRIAAALALCGIRQIHVILYAKEPSSAHRRSPYHRGNAFPRQAQASCQSNRGRFSSLNVCSVIGSLRIAANRRIKQ
jgi:hypothetical protein